MERQEPMDTFPVIFSYGVPIIGEGYVATVQTHGRLLLQEEEDGWWAYGVKPGSIAGGGQTKFEAWNAFRNFYHAVLVDLATEAADFEGFREKVEAFFEESREARLGEWEAATHRVADLGQDLDLKVQKAAKARCEVLVTEIVLDRQATVSRPTSAQNPSAEDIKAVAA
jgi:hypothetical protein